MDGYGVTGQNLRQSEVAVMGRIFVYAPDSMDWTNNGLAALIPTSCEVTEEAGGEYELTMTHPCDPWGKWKYLVNEAIIRVPVPVQRIPPIESQEITYWQVKDPVPTDVIVYAKPLIYTYDTEPSASAWRAQWPYSYGDYVTYAGEIWKFIAQQTIQTTGAPGSVDYWQGVRPYDSSRPGHWTGGGKIAQIYPNDRIIKLASYNSEWMRIRIPGTGIEGYVKTTYCEDTEEVVPPLPARSISEQCFRVYSVTVDSEDMSVTVNARHISFDFRHVLVGACEVSHATPSSAISFLQAATVFEDVRTIATNIIQPPVTGDWSWNNAIYALMDEEIGLVHQLRAKLIRDNNDFFILKNDEIDNGFSIDYGRNLIGVSWTLNDEDVVTRLIPRGETSQGAVLLLPELSMESPIADNYKVVREDGHDSGYKVGDEYTDEYGTTITLTEADVYRLMRSDCNRLFNVDKIDEAEFSLDVEFLMLGDTEEYKQHKGLQMLALYDTVRINHPPLGFTTKMQMRGYTWDAIAERYLSAHFDGYYDESVRTETLTRPEKAMDSDTQDGMVVSASSWKSTNPVHLAFDKSVDDGWVPKQTDTEPWIQIRLDTPLSDIKVFVYSRSTSYYSHPASGSIMGSNDGETWFTLKEFSGWTQVLGGLCGTVECENEEAYAFVRLIITGYASVTDETSIGYIELTGDVIYT